MKLIPRLPNFRKTHPGIDIRISATNEMLDLERDRIDVAIRYCLPRMAPPDAVRLFGEEVFPVCSPSLLRNSAKPLSAPKDLRHHVLLLLDDPGGKWPWLSWTVWLETMQIRDLEPAATLRISHEDQLIQAAVDGQGVVLGRSPLMKQLICNGKLVAPFSEKLPSARAYFVVTASGSGTRREVEGFVEWLVATARRDIGSGRPSRIRSG